MKYHLKDFLHKNNMLSHLVFNCISESVDGTDVIEEVMNTEEYKKDGEFDIKLLFNGHEVRIDKFLRTLENGFNESVEKTVKNRLDEIIPRIDLNSFIELEDKIKDIINEFKENLFLDLKIH